MYMRKENKKQKLRTLMKQIDYHGTMNKGRYCCVSIEGGWSSIALLLLNGYC